MYLRNLEEGKIYTITFDVNDTPKQQKIKCVRVIIKLENSLKIADLEINEIKWYNSNIQIQVLDEVPDKYFRKEKLEKLKEKEKDDD